MAVSIVNTNHYVLTVTIDTISYVISKPTINLFSTEPYLYFNWSQFNKDNRVQNQFVIDYNDVSSPTCTSAADLLTQVQAFIYSPLTGGVTTVTATSPLTSSGGATPNISTNMNTNKLIGRYGLGGGVMEEVSIGSNVSISGGTLNVSAVTSVAALTLGTTGTDLSSTVANGTTTPVITLNVPTASASNRGALSSSDWSTFNSKQAALSPAALTKIDDTNVTLTLGGTPSTALLQAASITAGWTGQLAIARGGTAASTELAARTNLGVNTRIDTYALLGSSVQCQTFGMSIVNINASITWSDARATYVLLDPMPAGLTITGVKFWQVTQGNYTADNNNKVGIYSYSGGTLTLVASCADDGNLWKGTSSTWATKAFSSTFVTVANTAYFVAALYNQSAVVQNPIIGASPTLAATVLALTSFDFTNSARVVGFVASQTDLPATQAMSGFTALGNVPYFAVY